MSKFCSICKKQKVDHLYRWSLNDSKGYICNKCLNSISHFIDEEWYYMPEEIIWQGLESRNMNDVETAINYLDQLPKTTETLDRLHKLEIHNHYLAADICNFCEELEEELVRFS